MGADQTVADVIMSMLTTELHSIRWVAAKLHSRLVLARDMRVEELWLLHALREGEDPDLINELADALLDARIELVRKQPVLGAARRMRGVSALCLGLRSGAPRN